ncbi:hypothetical protein [Aliikangiella maris]|uniref:Uncharacterized protein n=2 Tax=Aliikangiella maris TaxID=3162458 RepID=A0ABV2C070_9GAMM
MKTAIVIKKRKLNKNLKELTESQVNTAASKGSNEILRSHNVKNKRTVAVEEYTEWE